MPLNCVDCAILLISLNSAEYCWSSACRWVSLRVPSAASFASCCMVCRALPIFASAPSAVWRSPWAFWALIEFWFKAPSSPEISSEIASPAGSSDAFTILFPVDSCAIDWFREIWLFLSEFAARIAASLVIILSIELAFLKPHSGRSFDLRVTPFPQGPPSLCPRCQFFSHTRHGEMNLPHQGLYPVFRTQYRRRKT